MIAFILGLLDILTGISIALFEFGAVPGRIIFSLSFYLIIKAIVFFGDFMSIVDGIIGLYMMLMLIINIEIVSWLFVVYLVLKGISSLF